MSSSYAQYQEGKAGEGDLWEILQREGKRDDSLGKDLPRVSAGGTIFWSGDMGSHVDNESEVRGIACYIIETSHT